MTGFSKGDRIKLKMLGVGGDDDPTAFAPAIVILASLAPAKGTQSIAVEVIDGAMRMPDGGMAFGGLALNVDLENERVTDLLGFEYRIEREVTA